MTLRQFLAEGISFSDHLQAHHAIEEQHIFPLLAKRMPEFHPKTGPLVTQHAEIHAGLDAFTDYLRECQGGKRDFTLAELRGYMDPWGKVLWTHLDDEVKGLGADNMSRYWTKDEMMRMPM